MKSFLCIVLLSLLFFSASEAQSFFPTIKGKVIDKNSHTRIPRAYIWNESRRAGYFADTTGSFLIYGSVGDTIMFSSLGYEAVVVKPFLQDADLEVRLNPRVYSIPEVLVSKHKDYKKFKQEFMEYKVEIPDMIAGFPTFHDKSAPGSEGDKYRNNLLSMLGSPISALYYNFSKTERSKLKVRELQNFKGETRSFNNWNTRENLARYTKLKGDTLDRFILFCKISPESMKLYYNEYDYYEFIRIKLEAFYRTDSVMMKKDKPDSSALVKKSENYTAYHAQNENSRITSYPAACNIIAFYYSNKTERTIVPIPPLTPATGEALITNLQVTPVALSTCFANFSALERSSLLV
jgi:hypothetical protein